MKQSLKTQHVISSFRSLRQEDNVCKFSGYDLTCVTESEANLGYIVSF